MDKIPTIRAAAVSSLARLQNPLEADDTVTARYLCLLATDSSKYVLYSPSIFIEPGYLKGTYGRQY